ncbi:hypothetical protein UFOVP231_84 [uncultured Caudovirales phage]|uniref:Uncharacterized protein n=1 Tax=uncultured Caudovirales phage TaxID=2100421 RepID=A0A6J7WQZ1_9CAUD|nr:hypothetical protein UFOVP231_84 [uncultured Caudovirales phage]
MRIEPSYQSLGYYEALAKRMRPESLAYAVKDVKQTLDVMRERDPRDPYIVKLMCEFDAFTVEMQKRKRLQR